MHAMMQGHAKVEFVMENRRKVKENTNMNHELKRMMPKREKRIVHVQIGAVALVSA